MIWLIGSKGMLASEVAVLLDKQNLPWIGSDRETDITDKKSLENFYKNNFSDTECAWIINCAAYTAVDKAEDEFKQAECINAEALIHICEIAKKHNAKLIHISTDYVFDGASAIPYTENDEPNPQSVYGKTKLQGEQNIKKILHEYYIIRTAWLYGKNGQNFVSTMLRLMNERNKLTVVNDQRGSPTYAVDLAQVIVSIIQKQIPTGVYHYSNEGNISWYDFACEIYTQGKHLNVIHNDCDIIPCTSSEFPQKAKRPSYSLLDKTKIKTALQIMVPDWKESLKNYLKELR
ncbi:dTDP-4-dehydrorhamnose reductase [Treponema phagedenis]|uniref:dTDP-4-dehydrorhamnose reductase n=1 Tax=Treponema phagedenis TaxID=162 RepID=UPI00198018E3|nr:dTDP-4-dehydrorhamnose reductase [Treponema phagedenis]QSH99409.1 dTDP-4-dehydrorhamnose reductase [Treponema phagedenis]